MNKLEKVLVRLVVLGVVALVIVQLALARAKDPLDFYLTFSQKIESAPLEQAETTWQPNLVLTTEGGDGSKLKILVNDREVGDLHAGRLDLKVKKGDRLAAEVRNVPKGLRLKVSGVGQELTYPRLNQVWPLRGSILDLGEVQTK